MTSLLPACIAVGIQAMLAVSVTLSRGEVHRLSLGQAAFAGLGAYSSALLTVHFGQPFWLACPLSMLMTACIGLGLGLPILWRTPYYVPVVTLVLNMLVPHLLRAGRLLGGSMGLGQIPPPQWFGSALHPSAYLVLVGGALGACVVVEGWFRRSFLRPCGQSADGSASQMRSHEWSGLLAFGLAGAMAGLAGSLFAHFEGFINPFDFDLEASLFVLAMAVAGGLGSAWRALLGALILGGMIEGFRGLVPYRMLLSGVIFLFAGFGWPRQPST